MHTPQQPLLTAKGTIFLLMSSAGRLMSIPSMPTS